MDKPETFNYQKAQLTEKLLQLAIRDLTRAGQGGQDAICESCLHSWAAKCTHPEQHICSHCHDRTCVCHHCLANEKYEWVYAQALSRVDDYWEVLCGKGKG